MVTGFLRALEFVATDTGCAILLLGHPSKSAMTDGSFYSGSTAWDSMVRARAALSYQHVPNPDLLSTAEIANPILKLAWKKGNYSAKSGDIELRISFDDQAPEEEPPIFERIPRNETENRTLFMQIIDKLNEEGDYPRAKEKGNAKMLYAPTAVFYHELNRVDGQRQMTSIQAVDLYRSLMVELGLLKVVNRKDGSRHKIECIETKQPSGEREEEGQLDLDRGY